MLAKKNRYQFGETLPRNVNSTPLFMVRYQECNVLQVGIVVGKRISPKAVTRNRIKRLIFEAVSLINRTEQFTGKFVIYVQKPILDASLREIESQLREVVKKI